MSDEPKALRLAAIAWASAHPDASSIPGADLARAAFKAIEDGNKDSARRCISALGPQALAHRDSRGRTLLTAACSCSNFPEANRLLGFGASPFDIDAEGHCAWGIAMGLAQRSRGQSHHDGFSERERAAHFAESFTKKRKYKPIPWNAKSPQGHTLIESIFLHCPKLELLAHAQSAVAFGRAPREPFSNGLDLPCALLLQLALAEETPQYFQPTQYADSHWRPAALAFLAELSPLQSSEAAKASFARALALLSERKDRRSPALEEGLFSPSHASHTPLGMAAQIAREGAQILGRTGRPLFSLPERAAARPFTSEIMAELAGLHERGALAGASQQGSAPSPAPRL